MVFFSFCLSKSRSSGMGLRIFLGGYELFFVRDTWAGVAPNSPTSPLYDFRRHSNRLV
jgi:hypothetical protein